MFSLAKQPYWQAVYHPQVIVPNTTRSVLIMIRTLNLLRTTRSKLIPLLTGNCSFQEQHKRRLFLAIFILFDGTAHILHLLRPITLQWYCQLLYHANKWYILSRTQCGLSCRPRLSSVLIHMRQFFVITNVDCVVCNTNYNYVSWLNMRLLLSRTLIVLSVNLMIIVPPVWLLLSMLPLFQTFIIDYNYVCSLYIYST